MSEVTPARIRVSSEAGSNQLSLFALDGAVYLFTAPQAQASIRRWRWVIGFGDMVILKRMSRALITLIEVGLTLLKDDV